MRNLHRSLCFLRSYYYFLHFSLVYILKDQAQELRDQLSLYFVILTCLQLGLDERYPFNAGFYGPAHQVVEEIYRKPSWLPFVVLILFYCICAGKESTHGDWKRKEYELSGESNVFQKQLELLGGLAARGR